jgi:uncharacterized membrane protein YbhN (UPF0104 family)
LKKSRLIAGLVILVALVGFAFWAQSKVHFDFATFRAQLADVDWRYIVVAVACIYIGYFFRSWRWAMLMRHAKIVQPLTLMEPQIIGFTAVALLGRFADLTRPYLVSKKTGEPVTGQIGVYVVERIFDLGALAFFITGAMLLIPTKELTHPEVVEGVKRGFLIATGAGAVWVAATRFAGGALASFFETTFGLISKKLGHAVGQKLRMFHAGLDTIRTFSDFGVAAGLSLAMWFLILMAYFETTHAFRADAQLSTLSFAKCMVILACSGGASFFQPPVIGWFWQIGAVGEAIHGFLGVEREAAWACSTMLLVTTFLSVLPVGLVWAQFAHVNLRKIAEESEHAGGKLAENELAENEPVDKEVTS